MRVLTALVSLALSGCSSGDTGAGTAAAGGSPSSSADGGSTVSTGSGGSDDCSEAAKLVYVLTLEGRLFSFHPPTLDFIQIGKLECPDVAPHATLFSMSVARDGTAYVLYGDGNLQLVSTADASCTSSGYVPEQLGFVTFGMGFASEAAGSEALFAADYHAAGLARIDKRTLTMSFVGPLALSGPPELSGTGDGRLFGFFRSGAHVAEIDKTTAEILSDVPLSLQVGSAWAFAFWGGDFWLFTRPDTYSEVHRYRPSTGTIELMTEAPAMVIVGAGVSTCAPLEPPH